MSEARKDGKNKTADKSQTKTHPQIVRAARLQKETALEQFCIWHEKHEKNIRKTIWNVTENI